MIRVLRWSISRLVIVCFIAFMPPAGSLNAETSEDAAPLQAKLESLQASIHENETRFEEVSTRIQLVEKELRARASELKELKEQEGALKKLLQESRERSINARENHEKALLVFNHFAERFKFRLRAMERRSRNAFRSFLIPQSGQLAYRDQLFLKKISESDLGLLTQLIVARRELNAQAKVLESLMQAQEDAQQGISEKVGAQKQIFKLRTALLAEEKDRRATLKKVLASLKQRASEIDGILKSITSGEPESSTEVQEQGNGLNPPLALPVKGRLVQQFGKRRVRGLQDFVFSKGIELSSTAKSEVSAVAAGVVRFVGEMPGYGTTILIDHGRRFFSLYGRLSETQVVRGDKVASEAVIARTSEVDEEGRNFYFEIRERGVALNPRKFFRGL